MGRPALLGCSTCRDWATVSADRFLGWTLGWAPPAQLGDLLQFLRVFLARFSATMSSIPASFLAALAVLLYLNLADGNAYFESSLRRLRSEYSLSGQMDWPAGIDQVIDSASKRSKRRSRTRSLNGQQMVMESNDIMLTMDQYKRITEARRGRSAGVSAGAPWDNGIIPYEIMRNTFTQEQKNWIRRSMNVWEAETCVSFVPAHHTDKKKVIFKKEDGCWAGLGMQGGTQYSSLADGCFWKGTIEHELGHTMGLMHEHQRPNRDEYVKINYFVIRDDGLFQITKYAEGSDDKHGLPYDYLSVMHYTKTAFSKNWDDQTIYPKMHNKTEILGLVLKPSFYDIKLINLMYKCKDRCPNPPACAEPCFVNEHCKCYCPKDAPKEVCQDLDPECPKKAKQSGCVYNKGYMLHHCRLSCGICKTDGTAPQLPCVDTSYRKCTRASCSNPDESKECQKTCGLCPDYSAQPACEDKIGDCALRAERGDCDRNPILMLKQCRRSCRFCLEGNLPEPACKDTDTICEFYKANGGCGRFPAYTSQFCPKSCGNCDGRRVVEEGCKDYFPHCFHFAWQNKCHKVYGSCDVSCNKCRLTNGGGPTTTVRPLPVTTVNPGTCVDGDDRCSVWAEAGICDLSQNVNQLCQKSCRPDQCKEETGGSGKCEDTESFCGTMSPLNCQTSKLFRESCPSTCGSCTQEVKPSTTCVDTDPNCSNFSARSCQTSNYVKSNCPKKCGGC